MKIFFVILLFLFAAVSCTPPETGAGKIVIKGSDTMLPLLERLAGEYMINNPGVSIYVSGGGTAEGIEALVEGKTDICAASRTLRPNEAKALAEYYGSVGMIYLLAKDALTIYLNPDNPVEELTMEELEKIYTCDITNWKELGGPDLKIIPVVRPPNSGTHLYFREHILGGKEYCKNALVKNTTGEVISEVKDNINAIGYGGTGYSAGINPAVIEGIAPTENNARNDTYPITRYLHLFTSTAPHGEVKKFIDWTLTPAGQKIVTRSGYISLYEVKE